MQMGSGFMTWSMGKVTCLINGKASAYWKTFQQGNWNKDEAQSVNKDK